MQAIFFPFYFGEKYDFPDNTDTLLKITVKDYFIWKASAVYKHLRNVFKKSVLHTF